MKECFIMRTLNAERVPIYQVYVKLANKTHSLKKSSQFLHIVKNEVVNLSDFGVKDITPAEDMKLWESLAAKTQSDTTVKA